jgi:hypothetical protein
VEPAVAPWVPDVVAAGVADCVGVDGCTGVEDCDGVEDPEPDELDDPEEPEDPDDPLEPLPDWPEPANGSWYWSSPAPLWASATGGATARTSATTRAAR